MMTRLVPATSLLAVVDVHERLSAAMPGDALARTVKNVNVLLDAAKLLGVRVLATEQYPKGLGHTLPAIAERLQDQPFDKLTFDACCEPRFADALAQANVRDVIVVGMEAHVCVFQTAREVARRGYRAIVVADAVCSRSEENRALGLRLASDVGAVVAPTETVVFDWLERAGSDAFKAISKLLR
jgi:nicotinamidase-related amidase